MCSIAASAVAGYLKRTKTYAAFERVMAHSLAPEPVKLRSYCLMPNHWHLVLWPHADGDLSRLMAWISNTHVKRYRQHLYDKIGGHLYQGRFKSFPVQRDEHLLTCQEPYRKIQGDKDRFSLGNAPNMINRCLASAERIDDAS
ncbi:MAG TPA: transposase [Tepidisphaeraceae bacterium]|jgi:REP element-mobilizing transposase RayT|nr:transposase [Tepidisphaeraceae bacterium]